MAQRTLLSQPNVFQDPRADGLSGSENAIAVVANLRRLLLEMAESLPEDAKIRAEKFVETLESGTAEEIASVIGEAITFLNQLKTSPGSRFMFEFRKFLVFYLILVIVITPVTTPIVPFMQDCLELVHFFTADDPLVVQSVPFSMENKIPFGLCPVDSSEC